MDKLKFETPDMVAGNIDKIGELFPAAITEMRGEDGQIKKGINFEVLKQLLSRDVVDGDECYEFTWVGKKAAMAEAARPTTSTLRPVREDSRDWDTTQNLYIEGDNLEVLKILQESYLGKIKMIYIDPPYNSGKDSFIYNDSFEIVWKNSSKNDEDYISMQHEYILCYVKNKVVNTGQWFERKEGIEEIYNAFSRFKAQYGKDWSAIHKAALKWYNEFPESNPIYSSKHYSWMDDRGIYFAADISGPNFGQYRYDVIHPITKKPCKEPASGWRYPESTMKQRILDGYIHFGEDEKTIPNNKIYLHDTLNQSLTSIKYKDGRVASKQLTALMGKNCFSNPKDVSLLSTLIKAIGIKDNDIILDFFAGSGTTAEATLTVAAEMNIAAQFILVQWPENLDENLKRATGSAIQITKNAISLCDELGKPHNLTEIGKERIRRIGDKIQRIRRETIGTLQHEWNQTTYYAEHQEECDKLGCLPEEYILQEHPPIDTGFRVFRVDSSNMKDVYYHPEELEQQSMLDLVSNIKDDRTDLDLLYACLLDWGVEIHLPHTSVEVDGCTVHNVDNGALTACFSTNVPVSVVEYMAKQQPLRAVFRDSAFAADDAKINVTEIFKNLSPDTKVKVI